MNHEQPTDTDKRHMNTRFMEISIYFLKRFYGLALCNSNELLNNYTTHILLITNISNSNMLLKYFKNAHQYIINCLQKLCNSKAQMLICHFQILSIHLYNKCCQNCAYSEIYPLQICSYLNKQKIQRYRNG